MAKAVARTGITASRAQRCVLSKPETSLQGEYRSADDAVRQQIIKLQYQLGNDADATPRRLVSVYHGLDAQVPASALGVADARGDEQGSPVPVAGSHRRGEHHFGHRCHCPQELGQVNVRHLRNEIRYRILDRESGIDLVGSLPCSLVGSWRCSFGDLEASEPRDREWAR